MAAGASTHRNLQRKLDIAALLGAADVDTATGIPAAELASLEVLTARGRHLVRAPVH